MSLRDLTHESHKMAENHPIAKALVTGTISKAVFANFLFNNLLAYHALEEAANKFDLFKDMPDLPRAQHMLYDLTFNVDGHVLVAMPQTIQYCNYVASLTDPAKIMAHLYVRHMGDLFGGQIIKNRIPGPGTMYNFENKQAMIIKMRTLTTDDMAEEANLVFSLITTIMEELRQFHDNVNEIVEADTSTT